MKTVLLLCGAAISGSLIFAQNAHLAVEDDHAGTARPDVSAASRGGNRHQPRLAVPTLGFVLESTETQLVPIQGVGSAPTIGSSIPQPEGVSHIYLPPRQHYALVQNSASGSLKVWHLARRHLGASGEDLLDDIPGVATVPDSIVFSAGGSAAALFWKGSGRFQVLSGLPAKISITTFELPTNFGFPPIAAISDDGQLVAAADASGALHVISKEGAQNIPLFQSPGTLLFVPKTHNLIVSDSNRLLMFAGVESNSTPVIVADSLNANLLAATNDGDCVIALDTAQKKLYKIDPTSLEVTAVPLSIEPQMLVTLRNGHNFLLSVSPLSVWQLPADRPDDKSGNESNLKRTNQ